MGGGGMGGGQKMRARLTAGAAFYTPKGAKGAKSSQQQRG